MINKGKRIAIMLLMFCSIFIIGMNTYAHSGRTDSSGGHKDNKNKSGLGSYHYHCGGHPPHLHTGGVCPYSSKSKTKTKSTTTTKKTNTTTTKPNNTSSSTTPAKNEVKTIAVESVKIKVDKKEIEIGEDSNCNATVLPDNASNKEIKWSSSNEKVATIDASGKITSKAAGKTTIKVQSENGKIDQIEVIVKKKQEENTIPAVSNSIHTNKDNDNSNPVGTLVALGIVGGGAFLGYKKYKK